MNKENRIGKKNFGPEGGENMHHLPFLQQTAPSDMHHSAHEMFAFDIHLMGTTYNTSEHVPYLPANVK